MELTQKQKKLLIELLHEKNYTRVDAFATRLGVSARTVFTDLRIVETHLAPLGVALDKRPGVGVRLRLGSKERLCILSSVNLRAGKADPLSVEARTQNIALSLLYADRNVSMQEFSDLYYISKTSIAKDIERIAKTIGAYGVRLERSPKGVRAVGEEQALRRAIHAYMKKTPAPDAPEVTDADTRLDVATRRRLLHFFPAAWLQDAQDALAALETAKGRFLSDEQYVNLLTHILILLKRVQRGKQSEIAAASVAALRPLEAFRAAADILRRLGDAHALVILDGEIAYLASYLLGCNLNASEYAFSYGDNFLRRVRASVAQMCAIAANVLSLELSTDTALRSGLELHLPPMLNRCKFDIYLENPILEEIKAQYAAIFNIIRLASLTVEEAFSVRVNEAELGYLVLHFAAAAERALRGAPRKAIIVCHGGLGTSQLLAARLRQTIANLVIIDIVGAGRLRATDTKAADFIISTVPLDAAPKPVVRISPLLTQNDIERLNTYLWDARGDAPAPTPESIAGAGAALAAVTDEALIFTGKHCLDKTTLLTFLCEKLRTAGCVDAGFLDSVLERERLSPTFVGNGTAIPHGDEALIRRDCVAVCTTTDDVAWGSGAARLVLLIAIRPKDARRFKTILKALYRLISDDVAVTALLHADDAQCVRAILQKL